MARLLGASTSRAAVQRWIVEGRVLVQGAKCRASTLVPPGATIEVSPGPPPATELAPDSSVEFEIVFEDEHLWVVDKPAGLVVHPAKGNWSGTLVHGLLARGLDSDALAEQGALDRPGVVHRLDKGTSGLLVIAKDPSTREALRAAFARHDIDREYLAIVAGRPRGRTIETLHARNPRDRMRFTSLDLTTGKRAVTHVRVVEQLALAALVSCTLETGRTHQIRVHLAEQAKTPILGDPLYGGRPKSPELARLAASLGRQALHAKLLGFVHPATGRRVQFVSEPPDDFLAVLQALRAR